MYQKIENKMKNRIKKTMYGEKKFVLLKNNRLVLELVEIDKD